MKIQKITQAQGHPLLFFFPHYMPLFLWSLPFPPPFLPGGGLLETMEPLVGVWIGRKSYAKLRQGLAHVIWRTMDWRKKRRLKGLQYNTSTFFRDILPSSAVAFPIFIILLFFKPTAHLCVPGT